MTAPLDTPLSEVFVLASELGIADGIGSTKPNLGEWPGCWERQVDERWAIIINGHPEAVTHHVQARGAGDGYPLEVPPYHVAVIFNGWPAGILNAYGGSIAAGEAANEEALVEALKRALGRAP